MLGVITGTDTVIVDCIDENFVNSNVGQNYEIRYFRWN